jgi:hypothetical protein
MSGKIGKKKSRIIVEYALHDACKSIYMATCEITKTLPKELNNQQPTPEWNDHWMLELSE